MIHADVLCVGRYLFTVYYYITITLHYYIIILHLLYYLQVYELRQA